LVELYFHKSLSTLFKYKIILVLLGTEHTIYKFVHVWKIKKDHNGEMYEDCLDRFDGMHIKYD